MKRAAGVGSLVAVLALALAGCAVQVAGPGQDEPLDQTGQGLDDNQNTADPGPAGTSDVSGANGGLHGVSGTVADPAKPTPDPWRGMVNVTKPTPDPWRPGGGGDNPDDGSGNDENQGGTTPSGTTQSGTTQTSAN